MVNNKKSKIPIITLIVSSVLFAIITLGVVNGYFDGLNQWVLHVRCILFCPLLTGLAKFISYAGDWYGYILYAVILCLIPKTRRKIGIPLLIAIIMTSAGVMISKNVFMVNRPEIEPLILAKGFSFPSGHAMCGTVFWGLLAYLLPFKRTTKQKAIIWATATVIVIIICASRVYLGVHTPMDVSAGVLMGIMILCFFISVRSYQSNVII